MCRLEKWGPAEAFRFRGPSGAFRRRRTVVGESNKLLSALSKRPAAGHELCLMPLRPPVDPLGVGGLLVANSMPNLIGSCRPAAGILSAT